MLLVPYLLIEAGPFYCWNIKIMHIKGKVKQKALRPYCINNIENTDLSYDVASESEITPCNKIDKPLVVYRFTGNVMTSITTLRTK